MTLIQQKIDILAALSVYGTRVDVDRVAIVVETCMAVVLVEVILVRCSTGVPVVSWIILEEDDTVLTVLEILLLET